MAPVLYSILFFRPTYIDIPHLLAWYRDGEGYVPCVSHAEPLFSRVCPFGVCKLALNFWSTLHVFWICKSPGWASGRAETFAAPACCTRLPGMGCFQHGTWGVPKGLLSDGVSPVMDAQDSALEVRSLSPRPGKLLSMPAMCKKAAQMIDGHSATQGGPLMSMHSQTMQRDLQDLINSLCASKKKFSNNRSLSISWFTKSLVTASISHSVFLSYSLSRGPNKCVGLLVTPLGIFRAIRPTGRPFDLNPPGRRSAAAAAARA